MEAGCLALFDARALDLLDEPVVARNGGGTVGGPILALFGLLLENICQIFYLNISKYFKTYPEVSVQAAEY